MCNVQKLKLHVRCKTPEDPNTVYIVWKKGEQIGVCEKCWIRIVEKDWEIGEGPKLTMEEILSDKMRGIEGATLTEYKYRGVEKQQKEPKDEIEDFD